MDKSESVETWDKKKIFITFFVIILLGIGAYSLKNALLSKNIDFLKSVRGISIAEDDKTKGESLKNRSAPLSLQAAIKEKLDDLKKEVNSLNVADIATSSPQVQKIINDLNSLRDYPVNEAKEICQRVCSNL